MTKIRILSEIARTASANGGVPLGEARFESETGVRVREAGFVPNELNAALGEELPLRKYSEYVRELGRLPTAGELRLKRRNDPDFPSWNTFARFGGKADMVKRVLEFCRSRRGFETAVELCESYLDSTSTSESGELSAVKVTIGYVYIIKHGSRREYKIGRTNNRLRREGEIALELPEKIEPIHVIETDDPTGVEAYWHRRFADKRMKNEWFALTADDVRAFKRWRRIT